MMMPEINTFRKILYTRLFLKMLLALKVYDAVSMRLLFLCSTCRVMGGLPLAQTSVALLPASWSSYHAIISS